MCDSRTTAVQCSAVEPHGSVGACGSSCGGRSATWGLLLLRRSWSGRTSSSLHRCARFEGHLAPRPSSSAPPSSWCQGLANCVASLSALLVPRLDCLPSTPPPFTTRLRTAPVLAPRGAGGAGGAVAAAAACRWPSPAASTARATHGAPTARRRCPSLGKARGGRPAE
jgi:hypothetical protein